MKRLACCILILALLCFAGCSESTGIVGVWEEEIQVTILGIDQENGDASAVTRFTFREDGTGSWGTILSDSSHPEALREFRYTLEGDLLTLSYKEDTADMEFTVTLEEGILKLESKRGSFSLNRAGE